MLAPKEHKTAEQLPRLAGGDPGVMAICPASLALRGRAQKGCEAAALLCHCAEAGSLGQLGNFSAGVP